MAAYVEKWMQNLTISVPGARLVDLTGAGHFMFLTRESKIVREVKTFVAGLS
jgi:hypothetical protein